MASSSYLSISSSIDTFCSSTNTIVLTLKACSFSSFVSTILIFTGVPFQRQTSHKRSKNHFPTDIIIGNDQQYPQIQHFSFLTFREHLNIHHLTGLGQL